MHQHDSTPVLYHSQLMLEAALHGRTKCLRRALDKIQMGSTLPNRAAEAEGQNCRPFDQAGDLRVGASDDKGKKTVHPALAKDRSSRQD